MYIIDVIRRLFQKNNWVVLVYMVLNIVVSALFIVGMGIVGEEESENWKKIKSLKAVKNNKVFLLDSYVCSPTPMTFVDTVKKMMELMY